MINTSMLLLAEGASLPISLLEIVIHVLNLIILIIFLRMLVYNPTMKFIEKRRKTINDQLEEGKRLSVEAEGIKSSSQQIIGEARKNAEFISLQATKDAEAKSKIILQEAKEKSIALIEVTKKDVDAAKKNAETEIQQEVVDLAVSMASKILEREVSQKDNDEIIDECLSGWNKK